MRSFVAATCLSAIASSAGAAFVLNGIDLGGDASLSGDPILVNGGDFYQNGGGDNYPPTAAAIAIDPTLEDDSYIALERVGPSTATFTAAAPGSSEPAGFGAGSGHFDTPATLTGGWFGAAASSPNPLFGGQDTVFFAQLTVDPGATLSGANIVVTTTSGDPDTDGTRSLVLDGDPNGKLCAISSFVGTTTFGDKYVLYIYEVTIPAPGTTLALAPVTLLALRRRRN